MFKRKNKIAASVLSLSILLPLSTVGIASAVDGDSNGNSEKIEVVSSKEVPFSTRVVEDDLMPKGVRVVVDNGATGKQETVKITEDGVLFRKTLFMKKL